MKQKRALRENGVLVVISILCLLGSAASVPLSARAFSFEVQALFGQKAHASSPRQSTVQSMALIEASAGPIPVKGGGDIMILDDSAVFAEDGPSGTIADIEKPRNATISLYVVREGDTLSQVADMFDVSVNTILWANNLARATAIKKGDTLTILPVSGLKYTVKKGDTLESIAKKYQGDSGEIAQFNGLVDGELAIGSEIIIPNGEIAVPAPTRKATPSSPSPSYAGYYMRPTSGVRSQGIHGYNGVDIAAPVGTSIVASAAGDVIVARQGGWNGGYGSYVVIRHANGTQTLYAHASAVLVGVGQYVNQGETIARVGSSGRSTGAHLHFEIRGGPRNPF